MEVFGLGLKIKEEGAATVEAAMKKLNAEMTLTSVVAGNTGQQMDFSGKYAAKAAINMASLGAKLAETGTISGNMATKLLSVGSSISSMFGPGGLVAAAILGGLAAITTLFNKTGEEADTLKKKIDELTDTANLQGLQDRIDRIVKGTASAQGLNSITALATELAKLQADFPEAESKMKRFGVLAGKEGEAYRRMLELRDLIKSMRDELVLLQKSFTLATDKQKYHTVVPDAEEEARKRAKEEERIRAAKQKEAEVYAAALKAFDDQYYKDSEKSFNQRFDFIEQEEKDFKTALDAMMAQHAADSAAAFAFQMDMQAAAVRDSIQYKLGGGILDGMRAGFQAALASGDIKNFTTALAQTLSGSLSQAITDYLMTGLASLWKKFGKTLIQGLADVMADFAAKSIVFAKMVEAIKKFLAFGNGVGALIAATALLAFAHANGGKASMGSTTMAGGAGGLSTAISPSTLPTQQIIFGATSATTAAGMTPRQSMNVTVIGPNDPSAQRAIQELMTKANSRGSIG